MNFLRRRAAAGALLAPAVLCLALGRPPAAGGRQRGAAPGALALYNKHCASCHGRDGRAQTRKGRRNQARDLTVAPWQEGVTDERLFNSITHGLRRMPAFNGRLDDRQVESLVAYVRGLKK